MSDQNENPAAFDLTALVRGVEAAKEVSEDGCCATKITINCAQYVLVLMTPSQWRIHREATKDIRTEDPRNGWDGGVE